MPAAHEDLVDPLVSTTAQAAVSEPEITLTDRRRPGRVENINPHLIPLVRQTPANAALVSSGDDLRAASGIALSVILGLQMWAVAAAAVRFVFFD